MDLPLLLASAFLFGPFVAGSVAFLGAFDVREVRGDLPLSHSLFNRSQTALSVMVAAAVFAGLGGRDAGWPLVLLVALAALVADASVNYLLVSLAASSLSGTPLARVIAEMRFGSPISFAVTYSCFGVLSVLLSEIYGAIGVWGLLAFVVPLVLARQAFVHSRNLEESVRRLRDRESALEQMSGRILEERRDERTQIAAALHDDVLPALQNVTLRAQVIRQDLRHGKLLQLDEDLPELLEATELAADCLRRSIRRLNRSSIGPGGLSETLELLVRHLRVERGQRIDLAMDDIDADPDLQLGMYQIAKEAIVNAVAHAGASTISVAIREVHGSLQVIVSDDGNGFSVRDVDRTRHFGILLMQERVELRGGILEVESAPARGTTVRATFPRRGARQGVE